MHEKTRQVLTGVAALAAAGGVTAGIAGAAKSGKSGQRDARPMWGPGGGVPHDEPALTGDAKTKAEAAALEAVPGGKVWRSSEEDPSEGTGAKYEVHLSDADGAPVEVLLDADFKVVAKRAAPMGGPGMRHPRPAELTGETADKAKAAARAAVSGGTVRAAFAAPPRAGGKYVVIVTRANGRPVVVVLDEDFTVVRKLQPPGFRGHREGDFDGDGFGHGGPPPPGMPGPPPGPPPGAPDPPPAEPGAAPSPAPGTSNS